MKHKISKMLSIALFAVAVLCFAPFSVIEAYAATTEPIVSITADPNNEDFVCGQSNTQTYTVYIENFIPDCDWGISFFSDEACTKSITTDVPEGCTFEMRSDSPSWNPLSFDISAKNNGSELKGGTYYVKGFFWDPFGTGKWYYSDNAIAFVIRKADQNGPQTEDFSTVNETCDNFISGNADGSISGLTTDMEVSSDGGESWTKADSATLENLSAGTYKVRFPATDTKNASPACDVIVKASYKVTNFSNANGSVSATNMYYEEGETVALTTVAGDKYLFESVSYIDKNGTHVITPDKGSYSYVMPASAVTLSAALSLKPVHVHDWTYTASGATLTAVCKGSGTCDAVAGTLTIQAPGLNTYGGSGSAEATLSAKSFVGQDTLPVIHYARKSSGGTYENLQTASSNAGSYKAYITVVSEGNDVTASVEYTIAKKTISVTANKQTSEKGASLATLTYTSDTLLGTDKFTGSLATNANKDEVGEYEITQGTLTAGDNYSIKFTNGIYEVTKAPENPEDPASPENPVNPVIYVLLILVAGGIIFAVIAIGKKKRG